MKKFVAVSALILGVIAFVSADGFATAPTVGDIPDVQIYTFPSTSGDGVFDLDDFVEDYDDDLSVLQWNATPSGFASGDPGIAINGDNTVDYGTNGGPANNGSVLWTAEDDESPTPQVGSTASAIWQSSFWLTKPSLTDDGLVTTPADVRIINVMRDPASPVVSVGSLWSGITGSLSSGAFGDLSWTVSLRGLTDPTSYPKSVGTQYAGSQNAYGLTASVNPASGVFTLTADAGGLTDALEIGFLAEWTVGAGGDGSLSGVRVIAVQDQLPIERNSGDFAIEHGFETTYTKIPRAGEPGTDAGLLFSPVADFGWAEIPPANLGWNIYATDSTIGINPITSTAVTSIISMSDGGYDGPTATGGPLPSGKVLCIEVAPQGGVQLNTDVYAYNPGATVCVEYYMGSNGTNKADFPNWRTVITNFAIDSHPLAGNIAFSEIYSMDFPKGAGSSVPLQSEGWKKVQVYGDLGLFDTDGTKGFSVLFQAVQYVTSGATVKLYLDNVAVYEVKNPIELAYGATKIGTGQATGQANDDVDGTFERTVSQASPAVPDLLGINGFLNISSFVDGNYFTAGLQNNAVTNPGAFPAVMQSGNVVQIASGGGTVTNHTFKDTADSSMSFDLGATVSDNQIHVLRAFNPLPYDFAATGNDGPGVYQLSVWVSNDAVDRGANEESNPHYQWAIQEDGASAVGLTSGFIFVKEVSGKASPVAADGWVNYTITAPTWKHASGISFILDTIAQDTIPAILGSGSNFQGGGTIYWDDLEVRKVKDLEQYFDASLF
jgi:hypothetical protein